jgi:hypothetical protein
MHSIKKISALRNPPGSYSRSAIVFTLSVTAGWSGHLRTHVYVIMRICRLDACPEAILVVCPPEVASILGQ